MGTAVRIFDAGVKLTMTVCIVNQLLRKPFSRKIRFAGRENVAGYVFRVIPNYLL